MNFYVNKKSSAKVGEEHHYTELQIKKGSKHRENIWCALNCLLFHCLGLFHVFKMGFALKYL